MGRRVSQQRPETHSILSVDSCEGRYEALHHNNNKMDDQNVRSTLLTKVLERDLRRDRWLTVYIAATMILLITVLLTTVVTALKTDQPTTVPCIQPPAKVPEKLVCVSDYQDYCHANMDPAAWLYFSGGSTTELTLKQNIASFQSIKVNPRHLVDVSGVDDNIDLTVFGSHVALPVGISPTAYHKWAHPDGEQATARGAEAASSVYIASVHSNTKLEEIRLAAPKAILWQQTYIFANRTFTVDILRRAEKAGFQAIVLTIDKAADGISWNRKRGLVSWPEGLVIANFPDNKLSKYDPDLTWEDVRWFCSQTSLPVVLKGVLSPEDAEMAVDVGAKGVLVSNHGGRALDSVSATIDVLPEIIKAINGRLEVFLDGGVRTGLDVFKALSRGARMVFVGRPVIWGLGQGGAEGVSSILGILNDELVNTMKLSGTPTLHSINSNRTLPT